MSDLETLAKIIDEQRQVIDRLMKANYKLHSAAWGMLMLGIIIGVMARHFIQ